MVTTKIQLHPDLLGARVCNGIQHLWPTVGPVSAAARRARQWRMFTQRRSVWSGNYLRRNPGNFTRSERTCSEANSPSIINSPVLSFPTVTIAPSRLKLSLEETCCYPVGNTTSSLKHTHTHTSDGGSKWTWLYDPKLRGKRDRWTHERTFPPTFLVYFSILSQIICVPPFSCGFLSSTVSRNQFCLKLFPFFFFFFLLNVAMNLKQRMKLLKHFGSLPSEPPPPLLVVPVSGNAVATTSTGLGLLFLMLPQHKASQSLIIGFSAQRVQFFRDLRFFISSTFKISKFPRLLYLKHRCFQAAIE